MKLLLCLLVTLHFLPATALGLSPPEPIVGARSIGIVVSLARETTAAPWITKHFLEVRLREYLVEQIAKPGNGKYPARPDFPVRILDEQSFYARYESNYDVILLCNFRLSEESSVHSKPHLLSFVCAYDFFDSENGVLTAYTEKMLKASSVLVSDGESRLWADVVNRLQRDFLDRLIAGVRDETGPGLTELRSSTPGAAARLFNGVKVIGRSGRPCLYKDCLTTNPVVHSGNSTAIGKDALTRGLRQAIDLPGQPRPDITVIDPGDASEAAPGRVLLEMLEMQDLQITSSATSITIATLAYVFATNYGPGGEMYIAQPYAFVVPANNDAYKSQLEAQYGKAQQQIVERLRFAE
jgi:hypothetical protein